MLVQSNNDAKEFTLFNKTDGSMYVLPDKGSKGNKNCKRGNV